MLEKVKLLAKNPLAAASDEIETAAGLYTTAAAQENKGKKHNDDAKYETAILERAIVKIGHLLALGFGEAGSKILASNIGTSGDLNPMQAGQKVHAIFGFCNIRRFNETTEVLSTNVMLFVNEIAEITHSQVDKYGGSTNKNIGDAFLLVWKLKERGGLDDQEAEDYNSRLADLALFAFVKIVAKINKFQHILAYRKDPILTEKMPGYQVKMGFGLH